MEGQSVRPRSPYVALSCALFACSRGDDDGSGGDGDGSGGPDADTGGLPRCSLLIRGEPFASLVVEVDSVPGMEPDESNQDDLATLLDSLVDKPAGVAVVQDGALDSRGADHAWTSPS